jgi:hypothetical protein
MLEAFRAVPVSLSLLLGCAALGWACDKPDDSPPTEKPTPTDGVDADEPFANPGGMWMPGQLATGGHPQALAKLGLEYDPAALTQPTEFPLGAIVGLGGCSASFVSPDGLLITNHHCVIKSLSRNSTKEENLLEIGFLAKTRAEERWAGPDQHVYVTTAFTDVTDQVLAGLEDIADPGARWTEMQARQKKLTEACKAAKPEVSCQIASYFEGAQFFQIEQIVLRDIRLVHAPDAGIGVFGGEIDNWRWPRHTGDYSFYRAYVGPDGKPADHAEANVPYKPKHYLKVATEDLDPGDFVMVAGYPGRTSRLKTSAEVEEAVTWSYPRRIARAEAMLAAIDAAVGGDETLRIKAEPKVRGLANGLTNIKGQLEGLDKGGLAETRKQQEAELQKWIDADAQRKAAYGDVLGQLAALSTEAQATRERDTAFEDLLKNSELLGRALKVIAVAEQRDKGAAPDKAALAKAQESLDESQRGYARELDRAQLELALRLVAVLPAEQRPPSFALFVPGEAVDDAAIKKAVDALYAKTKLEDPKQVMSLLSKAKMATLAKSKDPFIVLALALAPMIAEHDKRMAERAGKLAVLRPRYIAALREFAATSGRVLAPDANSTLRVTYGTVRAYSSGGKDHEPFTTISQMRTKHTGEAPFDLPDRAVAAIEGGKFGSYVDPELNELPLNFLADLDITGGNSGSPTLNARGELIGLVFDGNYEAMASNWLFMPEITRSIHVDVRAILWFMDSVDGADHLLTEMGVTPSL